jgi:signal transduction histidine kinase
MTETPSFKDSVARTYQSFIASSPENKFRWIEYLLIVLAAVNQLCWRRADDTIAITSVVIPVLLLFVLFVVNSLPTGRSNGVRLLQILGELALILVASFLGPHRLYRYLYLVLLGKAALLLNRPSLKVVILVTIFQQLVFVTDVVRAPTRYVSLFPSLLRGSIIAPIEYLVYFVLEFLFVVFICTLLRSEQESRQRAEQLKIDMDSMSMTLERERIARDIHDSLGHALTGLTVQLQVAQKLQESDPYKTRQAIALARGFATRAVADVRRAIKAVRDSHFDFRSAVGEIVETIESNGDCTVTMTLDPLSVDPQLSHNLFFLIQESLTNIQRHAHATSILLELRCDDEIHLRVKDNGIGFSREDTLPGFGITGMEERVASLGGTMTIASDSQGTEISITVPLATAPIEDDSHDQSSRS